MNIPLKKWLVYGFYLAIFLATIFLLLGDDAVSFEEVEPQQPVFVVKAPEPDTSLRNRLTARVSRSASGAEDLQVVSIEWAENAAFERVIELFSAHHMQHDAALEQAFDDAGIDTVSELEALVILAREAGVDDRALKLAEQKIKALKTVSQQLKESASPVP